MKVIEKVLKVTRSGVGVAFVFFGFVGVLSASGHLPKHPKFWDVSKWFLLGDLLGFAILGALFLFVFLCIDPNDQGPCDL